MANRKAELQGQLRAVLNGVCVPSTSGRMLQAYPASSCSGYTRDSCVVWRQVDRKPMCSQLLLCIHQIHPPIKCNAVYSLKCQLPQLKIQLQSPCSTAATHLKPESPPQSSGPTCSSLSANLLLFLKPHVNLEAVVGQGPGPLSTHSWQLFGKHLRHNNRNNLQTTRLWICLLNRMGGGNCLNF